MLYHLSYSRQMVEGDGFEPSKRKRGRFTVCSLWPLGHPSEVCLSFYFKAPDILATEALIYRLHFANSTTYFLELAMGLEPATF